MQRQSCGKSTNVVFDRETYKLTHIVVEYKKLPKNPTRLVPIEKVESATQQTDYADLYL